MSESVLYVFGIIEIQQNGFQRVVMHVSIVREREGMLLDGKARRPVEGINGGKVKLPFSCKSELSLRTFAANHLSLSMLGSSL